MEDSELKPKYRYILDGISQIPSLPSIVSRILGIINNPRSSAEDVARYLEMDVGLSGKILRLANSSYYGIPGGITSIQRAVAQLGFNAVSSIVLSASVYNLFKNSENSQTMNRVTFWRHSIETALYCRVLAHLRREDLDPEVAFTQGMLHDLGALALDTAFSKEYAVLVDVARKTGAPLEKVEKDTFGLDHGQIGARMLERWGIPKEVYIPVLHHHNIKADTPYRNYCLVLALANSVSHAKGLVLYPQQIHLGLDVDATLVELGISSTSAELLMLFDEELSKAKLVMNLLRS